MPKIVGSGNYTIQLPAIKSPKKKVRKLAQEIIADNRTFAKWVLINKDTMKLTCICLFDTRKAALRMKTEKSERAVRALVIIC
jgi:hypothetical protein